MTTHAAQTGIQDLASRVFNPASAANPYPLYAQLRASGPIVPIPVPYGLTAANAWLITRFPEAISVLMNARFAVDATAIHADTSVFGQAHAEGAEAASFLGAPSMVSVDGQDHARLRGLVSRAFTPRYIETLRPRVQEIADALLDRVQARGSMDVVRDYGYPLPINVISEMLGVPQEQQDQMQVWAAALLSPDPAMAHHRRAFATYVKDLIAEKRQRPQDDLISQLVQAEATGDALSEPELLATVGLLIFAGHETTANLISIGTLMLLDQPDQLAALQADPARIPAAVEELLRFNGPVFSPAPRYALEDVEVGGQAIRRGDLVLVALGSANHDETQFTDPEELDIARALSRHLAFGHGVHFCLGAPLARLEGEIAFATLLRRMPHLRLATPRASIAWRDSVQLRGLQALPVAF